MGISDDVPSDLLAGAKWGSATVLVPPAVVTGVAADDASPEVGDVVLAEVTKIGAHIRLEGREGQRQALYPGDHIVGVLGHRYAPDQFEGYVGTDGDRFHLLSVAGVVGLVRSRHSDIGAPTRLQMLGYLRDLHGQRLNTRRFALRAPAALPQAQVPTVVVVGTMMNAGKTTTATSIIHGAARRGIVVAAAKVTGTASGKDISLMRDAGARRALDFTVCGWPSTYMCSAEELEDLFLTLYASLLRVEPRLIVLELADGIIQRETGLLLRSPLFRSYLTAVVLAAGDAMGAEAAAGRLRAMGLPVVAVSGRASMSPLLIAETESVAGVPCLTRQQLEGGAALEWLPEAIGAR
ncbi:MAG TPA: DUF1611 domain-containing protein [bacterium]|jgi:hypothetical protein